MFRPNLPFSSPRPQQSDQAVKRVSLYNRLHYLRVGQSDIVLCLRVSLCSEKTIRIKQINRTRVITGLSLVVNRLTQTENWIAFLSRPVWDHSDLIGLPLFDSRVIISDGVLKRFRGTFTGSVN